MCRLSDDDGDKRWPDGEGRRICGRAFFLNKHLCRLFCIVCTLSAGKFSVPVTADFGGTPNNPGKSNLAKLIAGRRLNYYII